MSLSAANVTQSLVSADELVRIFRLALGLNVALARRFKDRIVHAAQHGVECGGARATLAREMQLRELRGEFEREHEEDLQYTEEVRAQLVATVCRHSERTLRELNIFKGAQKRECPLDPANCPLRVESLKFFCRNASGASLLSKNYVEIIMSIAEQHCDLFSHDDDCDCSDPDLARADFARCHHSVPVCPLLRRAWVAAAAPRDQFAGDALAAQFHEMDERNWTQLDTETGATTQLVVVDECDGFDRGIDFRNGKSVALKTEDGEPRIYRISEELCVVDSIVAYHGSFKCIPSNGGISLPWYAAAEHLYCPIFAVVNLLSSKIDVRNLLNWPLFKHLHEHHHEHDKHRSDVQYGPCIQWSDFFTDRSPPTTQSHILIRHALPRAPKSVEHYLPSASDTSLSFITGVVHRRVTVFRNIAPALIKHCDVLKNTDRMASLYGDARVKITILEDQQSKPPFANKMSSLREHLIALGSNPSYAANHYLQQVDLQSDIPLLMHGAGVPAAAPNLMNLAINARHCHPPSIFIGCKGIRTSLHFDRSSDHSPGSSMWINDEGKHNLFVQVSGSRKFLLFPPDCRRYMRPDVDTRWGHVCTSTTFLHNVGRVSNNTKGQIKYIKEHYPWLAEMWPQRVEVILHEGDAILIPAKWLHCTEILSFSVAVNWWFPVDEELDNLHQFKD